MLAMSVTGFHNEGGVELTAITTHPSSNDDPAVLGVAEAEPPRDPRHLRYIDLVLLHLLLLIPGHNFCGIISTSLV